MQAVLSSRRKVIDRELDGVDVGQVEVPELASGARHHAEQVPTGEEFAHLEVVPLVVS